MHDPTREADWSLIEDQLPQGWRELASEMRLIRQLPEHMGQKILDIGGALRLVLPYVAQRGSMRLTIASATAAGFVAISQVAFFKWMSKIGRYLEALIKRMVDQGAYAAKSWGGYPWVAADATCVERPGAQGTTARLHYALRLSDLSPRAIRITNEKVGETRRNFDPDPGALWLVDRGYQTLVITYGVPPRAITVALVNHDLVDPLRSHHRRSFDTWTARTRRYRVRSTRCHPR